MARSQDEISAEQVAEIKAIVEREMPRIRAAAEKMVESMADLADVSQKQVLLLVLMGWIATRFDDMEDVERFTTQLKHELEAYIAAKKSQTH